MKRLNAWFKNLSRVAKVSVLSTVALGGLFVATATTPPPQQTIQPQSQAKQPVITYKKTTEVEPITFSKTTREDASLEKGKSYVETAGKNGEKTITTTITLTNNVETDRKSAELITKQPVSEVTVIGTYVPPAPAPESVPDCNPNYSGCVPNSPYDLDCADIGYSVDVIGYDEYGLDRDDDGVGCESY